MNRLGGQVGTDSFDPASLELYDELGTHPVKPRKPSGIFMERVLAAGQWTDGVENSFLHRGWDSCPLLKRESAAVECACQQPKHSAVVEIRIDVSADDQELQLVARDLAPDAGLAARIRATFHLGAHRAVPVLARDPDRFCSRTLDQFCSDHEAFVERGGGLEELASPNSG